MTRVGASVVRTTFCALPRNTKQGGPALRIDPPCSAQPGPLKALGSASHGGNAASRLSTRTWPLCEREIYTCDDKSSQRDFLDREHD
jgi:hypothetical protein